MAAKNYNASYCVKCHRKTKWLGPVKLKLLRNRVPALCGKCCECKGNKFTFVSMCYYREKLKKCQRGKANS